MKIETTKLSEILLIYPDVFSDERGFFLETYQEERYKEFGIIDKFVQDNHSRSVKNILRGLHYTKEKPQSQLLTVISGTIFDVVVDLRNDSSTYGQWFGTILSAEENGPRQVYMPHGFAHGFCVLSEEVNLHYKVTQKYDKFDEGGLNWADPIVAIDWPIQNPIVSLRDQKFPFLGKS